jgi:hypothetical protein
MYGRGTSDPKKDKRSDVPLPPVRNRVMTLGSYYSIRFEYIFSLDIKYGAI